LLPTQGVAISREQSDVSHGSCFLYAVLQFQESTILEDEEISTEALPQYSECGSPPQLLKIGFFFSTPDCKYHPFLNTNSIFLHKIDPK
jgi:hypothetical protein